MRLVGAEILRLALGQAFAHRVEHLLLIRTGSLLAQRFVQRRTSQHISETGVAGQAHTVVALHRGGPGEPRLLAGIEIIGGEARIPVSTKTGCDGESKQSSNSDYHTAMIA